MKEYLFTSESVSEGHPDKVADQISDAILDAYLSKDNNAKVAAETMIAKNLILVAGEITSSAIIDIKSAADSVLEKVGYTDGYIGFDKSKYQLLTSITSQSENINRSVELGNEQIGAGDQGLMFGYAVSETDSLMPLPIYLAHKILLQLSEIRKSGKCNFLLPDAKSQVTIRYRDDKPVAVEKIVVSTQHDRFVHKSDLVEKVIELAIKPSIPDSLKFNADSCIVNPSDEFILGGPMADVGLTGRKIIVDTYGGSCPHGGGAFSGKDPSKVDRSAAYMARYIAKNFVASGVCNKCTIQIAYVIGHTKPISVNLNFHNTGIVDEEITLKIITEIFDLSPRGIIENLKLRRPIYLNTAAYGHFGREHEDFTWEKTDKADLIRNYLLG
jgi:S-adenosylmethionine synthetase